MPDPQPSHLADALTRFWAVADSAVEHGRRVAGQARESGAAFDRETSQLADKLRHGELKPRPEQLTSPDLRAAATEYRMSARLPVPELPTDEELFAAEPTPRKPAADPPDDEDLSQERIMRKV